MVFFSYRFMDIFPNAATVREAQKELDDIIREGVFQITRLLKNTDSITSASGLDEDSINMNQKKNQYYRGV